MAWRVVGGQVWPVTITGIHFNGQKLPSFFGGWGVVGVRLMMSYRVTDPKSGVSTVFPSETVARAYARNVKDAVVEPADVECSATVTFCPKGSLEAQRDASKDFYKSCNGLGGAWAPKRVREAPEAADERFVETVTQARLAGASISDALDEGLDAS